MYGPPYICPTCQSKYHSIRGMIFPTGSYEGHPCQDDWHFPPKPWNLTDEDKKFLDELKISEK
jgi:hypothetical protein